LNSPNSAEIETIPLICNGISLTGWILSFVIRVVRDKSGQNRLENLTVLKQEFEQTTTEYIEWLTNKQQFKFWIWLRYLVKLLYLLRFALLFRVSGDIINHINSLTKIIPRYIQIVISKQPASQIELEFKNAFTQLNLMVQILSDLTCFSCGKQISSAYITSGDSSFHNECYVCFVCEETIVGIGYKNEGKLYCEKHNTAPTKLVCDYCKKDISGGAKFFKIAGKQLHDTCLKCCVCAIPLEAKAMYMKDNNLVCIDHAN